ncbi:MAG TPA: RNA methyltransferase [Mycobacteriales bacterium]|nr:RNA methyltransferase [Mycobacteriales bacterium]
MDAPKDRFVTVYGRRPVLEALADERLRIDKVILADNARGASAREIRAAAAARDVPVQRANPTRVKLLAGNGRHDQGVLADVVAPRMRTLAAALTEDYRSRPESVLLLDGITTPANVGTILRSATAAGIAGIVVPHHGVAAIDPLVVKSSAGVAFRAPVLRCGNAVEAAELLTESGYEIVGLAADGAETIYTAEFSGRIAFVVGSEHAGVSPQVRPFVSRWVSIPMAAEVESLNVSAATTVLCFELTRRRG